MQTSNDITYLRGAVAVGAALALALAAADAMLLLVLLVALLSLAVLWLLVMTLRLALHVSADHELLSLPLSLANDPQMIDLFRSCGVAMREVSANIDPIFRELALDRVRAVEQQIRTVASGRIEFHGTEAWRRAYEKLLRSRGLHRYRSVACIHTPSYWRDEPGRQSMQVNYEMAAGRLQIERTAIIADSLWPTPEKVPVEPIAGWLDEQVRHGILVRIVRASRVEEHLRTDMGLYGNRAVGRQEIDHEGRTTQFTLSFDFAEFLAAEAQWDRLSVYATNYQEILDGLKVCT